MGMFRVLPPAQKVLSHRDAEDVLRQFDNCKLIAVDTETTGLSRPRDRAINLALSDGVNRWSVWPAAIPHFKKFLEDPEVDLIFHNANFDSWMLHNVGINIYRNAHRKRYRAHDTMVQHALINDVAKHDLKSLCKWHLGIDMVPFKKVFGIKGSVNLEELLLNPDNEDVVANYASLDAYATFHLWHQFRDDLQSMSAYDNMSMWDYYTEWEVPFTRVLWEMELTGIKVDGEGLLGVAPDMEEQMLQIQKWFGRKMDRLYVNPNSNDEMAELFYNIVGHPVESRTASGAPSLTAAQLKKWDRKGCEYAAKLLEYREINKQLGTYVLNVYEKIHHDGRVHATFNQAGARSGRLSCIAKGTLVEVVRDVSKHPRGIPIEDVKVGDQVYSFNDEGDLVLKPVLAATKTGHRKVVRIHWQGDGRKTTGHLDLTPEHLVRLVTGDWVRADALTEGDRILSVSRGETNGYARLWATGIGEVHREHRFIYEQLRGELPEHVHHKNGNKLDNRLENLIGMTASEHTSHHSSNPSDAVRRRLSEASRKRWEENYAAMYDLCIRSGPDSHNWLGLTRGWIVEELHKHHGKPTKVCAEHGIDYATFQKYLKDQEVDFKEIAAQYNARGELIDGDFVAKYRDLCPTVKKGQIPKLVGMNYYKWAAVQQDHGYDIPFNHRVVRVEELEESVDVYDLTIAETSCFIANELCVHNCSDPNLQNQSPFIRKYYVPEDGFVLAAPDFSQLEMRILAHMTGDPTICDAIRRGLDVHCATASTMFGVTYEQVKSAKDKDDAGVDLTSGERELLKKRKASKNIGFGYSPLAAA